MSGTPSLSIIVFAYNEAPNVEPVLSELCGWLQEHLADAEVIFVDDGSTDASSEAAAAALANTAHRLLRHESNRGIGAALKTGVRVASAPWVTFLPADGQIEPAAIGTLLEEQRRSGADVVFSVYEDRDDGLSRAILSSGVRMLIRVTHGARVRCDGPYLFRRVLFDPDRLHADSFFLNFEFPIRVTAAGAETRVVSIRCRHRRAGASKSARLSKIVHVTRDLLALRVRRTLERLGG